MIPAAWSLVSLLCLAPGEQCRFLIGEPMTIAECQDIRGKLASARVEGGPAAFTAFCAQATPSTIIRGKR